MNHINKSVNCVLIVACVVVANGPC